MPGLNLTRGDIDAAVGESLRAFNVAINRVNNIRDGLRAYADAELEQLGYSAPEVAALRAALNDMDQLFAIYRGAQSLAVAKDFRDNAKRLWGLGI